MLSTLLAALLAIGGDLLPYPGSVYVGSVTSKDDTQCHLVLWEGLAPYLPLLTESEQRKLEAILDDVRAKWFIDDSWPRRAALLSPYHRLLYDSAKDLPFRRKAVLHQQFTLTCGGQRVRGGLAWFPPMGAGGFLVLKHTEAPEYLVLVDFEPRAKEQIEEISTFVAKYRAELEKTENPNSLPPELQKEAILLQKRLFEKSGKRIQFWDVNGIVLPSCPGACPPGTLTYAFAQLSPEVRRACSAALGLLAVGASSESNEATPRGRLVRFLNSWPEELGENAFLGVREELKTSQRELLSFSPPEAETIEELWGRKKVVLPSFTGDVKKSIHEVMRSF